MRLRHAEGRAAARVRWGHEEAHRLILAAAQRGSARRRGRVGMTWASPVLMLLVALAGVAAAGAWSASGADDPVIDPDVRAAIRAGTARVLVDLRVAATDPSAIGSAQDETLRRLAGTGARLARRFSSAPLLALEIDAPALSRLEAMRDLVTRVRADRITPLDEEGAPRR